MCHSPRGGVDQKDDIGGGGMSKRVISLLKEIVLTIAIELLDIAPLLNVAFRVHSAVCVKKCIF